MAIDVNELTVRNKSDRRKINTRKRIMNLHRSNSEKHLKNMWRAYDESTPWMTYSDEHFRFLMGDPVFAAMQHIWDITVDGSGDRNRRVASDIMVLMRGRKLNKGFYSVLSEVVESGVENLDLTSYLPKDGGL